MTCISCISRGISSRKLYLRPYKLLFLFQNTEISLIFFSHRSNVNSLGILTRNGNISHAYISDKWVKYARVHKGNQMRTSTYRLVHERCGNPQVCTVKLGLNVIYEPRSDKKGPSGSKSQK